MFQSTSSSREEEVEFSTKFSVIETKPATFLSFHGNTFSSSSPYLSLFSFFIVLDYSPPSPTEIHVEIHRRNSAATKPRMTFFSSFFHFYKRRNLVRNIITRSLLITFYSPRKGGENVRGSEENTLLPPLVTPFNLRNAKKFPPPYFTCRASRSRSRDHDGNKISR